MPSYAYRIEGGDESDGFDATIGVFAASESMAHIEAQSKAEQVAVLMGLSLDSVTVTLVGFVGD